MWDDTHIYVGDYTMIGDNTVIGAGSVVAKDIPANVAAVGNPCGVMRGFNEHGQEYYYKRRKIDMDQFVLVRPAERYAAEISAYRQEFLEANSSMDGCGSLRRIADPTEWIADTETKSKETCPKELVPATQFLYIRKSDERLIGMIQIRHELNEYLEKYAGHIGYAIRPSEREKGYAKRMLKDALLYCKEIG